MSRCTLTIAHVMLFCCGYESRQLSRLPNDARGGVLFGAGFASRPTFCLHPAFALPIEQPWADPAIRLDLRLRLGPDHASCGKSDKAEPDCSRRYSDDNNPGERLPILRVSRSRNGHSRGDPGTARMQAFDSLGALACQAWPEPNAGIQTESINKPGHDGKSFGAERPGTSEATLRIHGRLSLPLGAARFVFPFWAFLSIRICFAFRISDFRLR